MNRRGFLFQTGGLLPALWAQPVRLWSAPRFAANPFSLGIASGEPAADGFVLWTRLAPKPLEGGGMPNEAVAVDWVVAEDENLRKIVKKGRALAAPALAHSVHVEVAGLRPDRWYWYQFRAGGVESPVGRTRTTPTAAAAAGELRFAFASCQHYETGLYTAYEHMLRENPDLVVHLGDYIYEGAARTGQVRAHTGGEIVTLSDYRNRHALYKTDKALQAMHAAAPWIVTWDDHEVDNNYAADIAEDKQTRAELLERRANAYQAYYENMPLRAAARPQGSSMLLYRGVNWGSLAQFTVLDTRQYRTDQPCGDGRKAPCKETYDPSATLLGETQHRWLEQQLTRSRAAWNVIAQQILVAKIDHKHGDGELLSMDQWSGYEACRDRLLRFLGEAKPSNPVVITGDIHSNWAADLRRDWTKDNSPAVAVEFTGTSITSGGDGAPSPANAGELYAENPHLKFCNAQRGYVSCKVSKTQFETSYRIVPFVTRPGAPVETPARFIVDSGNPGLQRD